MDSNSREQRRDDRRRRLRQERLVALLVVVAVASFSLVYFLVVPALRGPANADRTSATAGEAQPAGIVASTAATRDGTSVSAGSSPTATSTPSRSATANVVAEQAPPIRPRIKQHPIEFGSTRQAEMKAYSRRHYGDASIVLDPKVVVLHYTAGGTVESAWDLFNSDQPNVGEKPGTVTHFIIDKDGTIHQLIPLDMRGRHTIGLNHVAIGIEFVQDAGSGDTWATSQILHRATQIKAGLALVRWLQYRFDIKTKNVIGHGSADDSPFFKDLEGWTNDHGDWGRGAVATFQKRLEKQAEQ
jgi:hypothetical protein